MADTFVLIGGIQLSGFEIPAEIPYGGTQQLKVHQLLGGKRVIDALGASYMPISWSGRFQGADAEDRARAIEAMWLAGQQVGLTWGEQAYAVVISELTIDWQRFYQQPYSITCTVVSDNAAPSQTSDATLDDLVDGDTTAMDQIVAVDLPETPLQSLFSGIASVVNTVNSVVATVQGAVADVEDAIGEVKAVAGALEGASLSTLGSLTTTILGATSTIEGVLSGLDVAAATDGVSIGGVVAGGFAPTMIASFVSQVVSIDQQASVQQVYSLLRRVETNVNQATG